MDNLRLKSENSKLERKNIELQNQIHDLMTKNNSLNQEILYLKYSNKEPNFKQPTNNNLIIELNKTISDFRAKINQITKEKMELMKINNQLKLSNNTYLNEKQKQLKKSSSTNNDLLDSKKINEILNKNLMKLQNDIGKNKKIIQELTDQNNNIKKQLSECQKENEQLNKKITDKNKIIEDYKEKCSKIRKELIEEKDIISFNEQKIKELERKLEVYNINELYDDKIKTYKGNKISKVNEIEMEKFNRRIYLSPCCHKNTSTFSSNNTTNKLFYINNLDDAEISPDKYVIIKQFKLSNNLKWYLLKKIKKQNSDQKEDISPSKSGSKRLSRRSKYNGNSKGNNIGSDDSYSDFVWKSNKNEKDFINFNTEIMDDDDNEDAITKQKKITELESCVKELEEKLAKKENDCNRINLNYAKLFKRSRIPELSYDKLLENINNLKEDNKNLNKKIEKMKMNQNFIGFSFIEDDLSGSRFIDDKCFEEILNEISNEKNNRDFNNINMMKYFRSHEDDKEIYKKDRKRLRVSHSDKKIEKQKIIKCNNNVNNVNNEIKSSNLKMDNFNKYLINTNKPSPIKKDNIPYSNNFTSIYKTPSRGNIKKDNKNIILMNFNNNNINNNLKNDYEKRDIIINNNNNLKNDYDKRDMIINNRNLTDKAMKTISNDKDYNKDKNNLEIKYKFPNRNCTGSNINIFNRNNSKLNILVSEKTKTNDCNYYRNSKTVKMENSTKNENDKKNEKNEKYRNTIQTNQYSIDRRFYRKRIDNIKSNDFYDKFN